MDEWLDTLSVNMTTRVRIPLDVLFYFFFLSLLAWVDICAAELATWGVGLISGGGYKEDGFISGGRL